METPFRRRIQALTVMAGAPLLLPATAPAQESDWQLPLDDPSVSGGPATTIAGPYAQVLIGGGRRR